MLLVNLLKAFMPKEAADKIAGMIQDGTFDRIGALPQDIVQIKAQQRALAFQLQNIERLLSGGGNLPAGENLPVTANDKLCGPGEYINGGIGEGAS